MVTQLLMLKLMLMHHIQLDHTVPLQQNFSKFLLSFTSVLVKPPFQSQTLMYTGSLCSVFNDSNGGCVYVHIHITYLSTSNIFLSTSHILQYQSLWVVVTCHLRNDFPFGPLGWSLGKQSHQLLCDDPYHHSHLQP